MASSSYVFTSAWNGSVRRHVALHGHGVDAWEAPVRAASPVVVARGGVQDDDAVYVGTMDGRIVRLGFHSGTVLGEFPLEGSESGGAVRGLALAGGVIYAAAGNYLYAHDPDAGTLWKHEAQPYFSAPVVVGDRVYAMGDDLRAYGLDGTVAWSHFVYGPPLAPVVADGVVYGMGTHLVFALDAATGALLWQAEVQTGHPDHYGLAVAGGRVYASGKSSLYALDAATGSPEWKAEPGADVTPPAATMDGELVLAAAAHGDGLKYLHAWHAADGTERWVSQVAVGTAEHSISAAAEDPGLSNHVFVTSEDRHAYAFSASDGRLAWRAEIDVDESLPLRPVASEDPPAFAPAPGCLGMLLAPWRAFRRGS